MAGWTDFVADAPELAGTVQSRFAANLHHVLGTIRASGAPRLSGTEVKIDDGRVTVGMMADSRKLADARRDPRVEIHCAPLDLELHHGDARLTGRLVPAGVTEHQDGFYFVLDLEAVQLIQVDGDELVVSTWTPGDGVRVIRRK